MRENDIDYDGTVTTGTSSVSTYDSWGSPSLVGTTVLSDSIELIYRQRCNIFAEFGQPNDRVFKIVFSCVDGKWNKSEPIYGKIVPAAKEYYTF